MGGILGGIVNEARSFMLWHCDCGAYGRRYVWKTLIAPWIGAILAMFVYALVQSGIAVVGGEFATEEMNIKQILSIFALGALAGYGSRKVFVWLDAQVNKVFKLPKKKENDLYSQIPDVINKSRDEAEKILKGVELKLGKTTEKETDKEKKVGFILDQHPDPGFLVKKGSKIDGTIGIEKK